MKRFASVIGFVFLAAAVTIGAAAPVRAGPAILVDSDSGEVLFAHRAFDRWHPASITKLMTAYLAFSALRSGALQPDSPVLITKNALSNPPSKMGFPVGTRVTLSSALKMLIVKSANDIAVAVAETVRGQRARVHRDDERNRPAPRHDLDALRQPARPAFAEPVHYRA